MPREGTYKGTLHAGLPGFISHLSSLSGVYECVAPIHSTRWCKMCTAYRDM